MEPASVETIKTKLLLRRQALITWVDHWEHDLQLLKKRPVERVEKAKLESSTLMNLKMDER